MAPPGFPTRHKLVAWFTMAPKAVERTLWQLLATKAEMFWYFAALHNAARSVHSTPHLSPPARLNLRFGRADFVRICTAHFYLPVKPHFDVYSSMLPDLRQPVSAVRPFNCPSELCHDRRWLHRVREEFQM
jgi:hypothetical protein